MAAIQIKGFWLQMNIHMYTYGGKTSVRLVNRVPGAVDHYSDVIMGAMVLRSPASRLFTQPFIQAQIKEKS